VNPFFALDRFGVDTIRYYLAHDGGIVDDADYENKYIVEKYKKGLQGGLGNLVSRITRPKIWNVENSIKAAHDGTLLEPDESTLQQLELLESVRDIVTASFDQLNPGAALHHIMNVVYEVSILKAFSLISVNRI
jgi:methionyl-tRNA synthetase